MPELRQKIHHANISIVAAAVVLLIGVILLKDAGEAALQALGMGAFVFGFVLLLALDERYKRRHRHSREDTRTETQ